MQIKSLYQVILSYKLNIKNFTQGTEATLKFYPHSLNFSSNVASLTSRVGLLTVHWHPSVIGIKASSFGVFFSRYLVVPGLFCLCNGVTVDDLLCRHSHACTLLDR